MSESIERVTALLHTALLMRAEPGEFDPGIRLPYLARMEGEDWLSARERIEQAEGAVVDYAEDIDPIDLTATARAFRVMAAAEEWAGSVVDERRFYRMSQTPTGAPTVEWEAAAMRLSDAEAKLLTAVLGETVEGEP